MKKFLFIVCFCLFSFSLLGQERFEAGYIIEQERDTITGFILEGTDEDLVKSIKFKKESNHSPVTYTAKNLHGFGFIDGREFQSHSIPGKKKGDSLFVFAKNLVRGKVDLFVWRSPQRYKPDFFLKNNETGDITHLRRPEKTRQTIAGEDKPEFAGSSYLERLQSVKGDTTVPATGPKYSEKRIKKDILRYNKDFADSYPVEVYDPKTEINVIVLAGIPFKYTSGAGNYRAALYISRERPEREENFFLTHGIIYHYNEYRREIAENFQEGEVPFKSHLINLVPLAIKFQGGKGFIQPYGYAGAGIAVEWETNLMVENYQESGTVETTRFFPTLNAGIGAILNTGAVAIVTELTPTLNGLFFNLGFSF